ncbi:hypothetical protein HGH93_02430 [Chitinophaga polysaccharea]|uniref:glycosyltransferase family 10 domain-containing protein n=1 Tax=Chitinophaga polysaccharea TaxID=1293035 RepID=UPI00145518DA|nr:glycosyltransferase family 10 [Chitinophaga polysaccharea]NLR56940.1 hypothetical protein [Chitinophaga polysaccharea]
MKVRVTCFWEDDAALLKSLSQYAFGYRVWKDMELVLDNNYDVLVILTHPHQTLSAYDWRKAITIMTEPPSSVNVRPHETTAIVPMYLPLPFWSHLSNEERQYLRRTGVPKRELFSSVTSELGYMKGHRLRLELIYMLDKKISAGFDLWGKKYTGNFFNEIRAYKGELVNKYDALWKYQYHFACENSFFQNYFTEKIIDPIITETLCFYDGCENIDAFIDERSYIRVNVHDPFSAIEKIIHSIDDNEWSKRVRYIKQQKKRVVKELNPLNIIWLSVKGKDVLKECML